ncbi:MAG: hypothetical protein ACTSWM_04635, partial [Alphaproteobacteria bacterium]
TGNKVRKTQPELPRYGPHLCNPSMDQLSPHPNKDYQLGLNCRFHFLESKMSEKIEDKEFDSHAIREALYGNAFSDGTEKSGRTLLLVATVTLIIAVFDVAVTSTPFVPLDFSGKPEGLVTFLAIANVALLINYMLRALSDLLRAKEDWAHAGKSIQMERVWRAEQEAANTEKEIMEADPSREDYGETWDEWWENCSAIRDDALQKVREIDVQLGQRTFPIIMRWVRLIVLGGLPLLVGFAALGHTWENVVIFFLAVVGL